MFDEIVRMDFFHKIENFHHCFGLCSQSDLIWISGESGFSYVKPRNCRKELVGELKIKFRMSSIVMALLSVNLFLIFLFHLMLFRIESKITIRELFIGSSNSVERESGNNTRRDRSKHTFDTLNNI